MAGADRIDRDWPRAVGLLLLALILSVVQPLVLVAVPLALLAFALPVRPTVAVLVGALALLVVFTGGGDSGIWFVERGWAILAGGWFVVLARQWPVEGFFSRGLGAVAGAGAGAALLFALWPQSWRVADWMLAQKIVTGAGAGLEALRLLAPDAAATTQLADTVRQAAEFQATVAPALLGLSTLAALGVAWWLHHRMVRGGAGGLAPVTDFRFHDQLVWIFIVGLALLLWGGSETGVRIGANAVVFMGGLYALRGWGVFLALNPGFSVLGYLIIALGVVLAAPFLVAAAVILGLSDTWFDLRARGRSAPAGAGPDGSG